MESFTNNSEKINKIWGQKTIPVIYRKGDGYPVLLRLPYIENNRNWLKNYRRNNPVWHSEKKYWEIPKAWFNDTIERCLLRFKRIYIIQPHRTNEICAPACWNAQGYECNCSCLGANHGSGGNYGFFIVSESFAFKWGNSQLACRLLTKKTN